MLVERGRHLRREALQKSQVVPEGLALKEAVNAGGEAGEIEERILRNEPTGGGGCWVSDTMARSQGGPRNQQVQYSMILGYRTDPF